MIRADEVRPGMRIEAHERAVRVLKAGPALGGGTALTVDLADGEGRPIPLRITARADEPVRVLAES